MNFTKTDTNPFGYSLKLGALIQFPTLTSKMFLEPLLCTLPPSKLA